MRIKRYGTRRNHGESETQGRFDSIWSTNVGADRQPGEILASAFAVPEFVTSEENDSDRYLNRMQEPVLHNWTLLISLAEFREMVSAVASGLDLRGGELIGPQLAPCLHDLLRLATACVPRPPSDDDQYTRLSED